MIKNLAAYLMKMGSSRSGGKMLRALNAASLNCRVSQERVLLDILHAASDTEYGRTHRFERIRTIEDFRANVPVNTYEDIRPFVERHAAGESDVLIPGKPIFYATTSGTTSAPKLIPISESYHRNCYAGLNHLWLHSMFAETPGFMDGNDLSMVGKAVEGHTSDGTPFGSFSGHLNAFMPGFVKRLRVIPHTVHNMEDYTSKYYVLMRMALGRPMRWIVAPNPSTLLELNRFAQKHLSEIIRDIERGTLKPDLEISPEIRRAVEARLRPDRKRAAVLSALESQHGTLLPKHYWPSLQVINTWTAGNAALYLRQTEDFYPAQTVIREFGYVATEARAGIILHNDQRASILAAHMMFFEFVAEEELHDDNRRYLTAFEVEQGRHYGIFVTTPGGLYRYDMNDIMRVDGFYNGFPMVTFLYKGAGVTSLTGEKLSEGQFLSVMAEALSELHLRPGFHIAFADTASREYHVFVEADDDVPAERLEALGSRLDDGLDRANQEYSAKRRSGRLSAPRIFRLPIGTWHRAKDEVLRRGRREGQFKLIHLQQNQEMLDVFRRLSHSGGQTGSTQ